MERQRGEIEIFAERLKNAGKAVHAQAHRLTVPIELMALHGRVERLWPPLFIIGPPRSGTTLLYQLLAGSCEFAYFPNIANRFYLCPAAATRFAKRWCRPYSSSYRSHLGFEKGCMAPSEAGSIWNRWFPHEKREGFNVTPAGYLGEDDCSQIRRTVSSIETICRAPFLCKNVKMSVRLPAIRRLFPDALFLRIRRDPLHAALSILAVRRRRAVSWWSVLPGAMEDFAGRPDYEQACHQVYQTERRINDGLAPLDAKQHFSLWYQDLCDNPGDELGRIGRFIEKGGGTFVRRTSKIPDRFPLSQPDADPWIAPEEVSRMKGIIKGLFAGVS